MNETKSLSRDHAALSEVYSTHLVGRLNQVMEDVQRIYKRVSAVYIHADRRDRIAVSWQVPTIVLVELIARRRDGGVDTRRLNERDPIAAKFPPPPTFPAQLRPRFYWILANLPRLALVSYLVNFFTRVRVPNPSGNVVSIDSIKRTLNMPKRGTFW